MTSKAARYDEILTIVQNIIADLTGNEIEDVDPMYDLEEELGITEIDFRRIIKTINEYYDIHLDLDEVSHEAETVEELTSLVQEEAELG
jgi:acyl carrier protein